MENTLPDLNEINETLKALDSRLSRIENYLRIPVAEEHVEDNIPQLEAKISKSEEELEMRIGSFWLPKIGVFAFLIGIAFFLTQPLPNVNPFIPPLGTYLLSILIVLLSKKVMKEFADLSGYLFGGSAGIAFIATLRLHYFTATPLIDSTYVEFILLFLVAASTIAYAVKNQSIYILGLGLLMGYISALITDSPFVLIPVITLLSAFQVMVSIRYEWKGLLAFGIVFSNLFYLSWALNNPFIGKALDISKVNGGLVIFLLLYSLIFSIGILKRKNNQSEEFSDTLITLLNSVGGYFLFLLLTYINKTAVFPFYHVLASAVFLAMACAFWVKERSKDMTYILAMTGYAALSVAIIVQFNRPESFIFLCFQSLIVLSTAIWFRSKFIIFTNFGIFLGTMLAYLFYDFQAGALAVSFGIVGLASARILHWKKNSLDFSTEKIRNGYLLITLIIFPYTFGWYLSSMFAGLAMLALALVYLGISKVLKNIKYRYMSVLTLVISAIYLMILGFTNADVTDKITSFIASGVVLILVSAVYSRMRKATTK